MSKNVLEPGRPQIIWRGVICWVSKATRAQARARPSATTLIHTQACTYRNTYNLLFFHSNNGFVNAPQCYGIRTLPVLLVLFSTAHKQRTLQRVSFHLFVLHTNMRKRRLGRNRRNMSVHPINMKRPELGILISYTRTCSKTNINFMGSFRINTEQFSRLSQPVCFNVHIRDIVYFLMTSNQKNQLVYILFPTQNSSHHARSRESTGMNSRLGKARSTRLDSTLPVYTQFRAPVSVASL